MTAIRYLAAPDGGRIGDLLDVWRADDPDAGLFALVAEADRETAIPALQRTCGRMGVPLKGAVFPGLFSDGRFHAGGCLLVRSGGLRHSEIYGPLKPSLYASAVGRMSADVEGRLKEPRGASLFMVFDAMVVNIATLLDQLYLRLADHVRYMGVNAGSETFRPMPCLFDNERVAQDSVLLMLLPDHEGAVVEHCYSAPDRMCSATSTEGNRIISIDWRPAFDVYREVAKAEYGVDIDAGNFYRHAVHFPFGILRVNGEVIVRFPAALEKDGSIFCIGEVPPNSVLALLRSPEADAVHTVEGIAREMNDLCGDLSGADILAFYCAGRKMHLGYAAGRELDELGARLAGTNIAGALSLGEIGHSLQRGYPVFHNGAILCCRWGRR